MRRFKFTTTWAGSAVAALAFCQINCKGPLDDEDSLAEGLVPPVGQPVAGSATGAPAQIDPNNVESVLAQPTPGTSGGFGSDMAGFGQPAGAGIASAPLEPVIPSVPYVIQKGDSLSKIAETNNTSVATLQKLNGIKGTFIRYGQTIKVPAPAGAAGLGTTAVPSTATVAADAPAGFGSVPSTVPTTTGDTLVPPPAPATGGGVDTNGSGLGFGGTSAPRPRTPATTNDDFLNLPAPN